MTPEDLAQIAYEAHASRYNYLGQIPGRITPWDRLPPDERQCWLAAASAVKGAVLGPMTKVNET